MASLLDDVSLLHDNDLVSRHNSAQSVSNDDHSLPLLLKESTQGSLDLVLALGIQSTRCLVQKQDARLAHQGTSDGYALFLASRKTHASLTDLRVKTLREQLLIFKESATCLVESGFHPLFDFCFSETRLIKSVQDVVTDGGREQVGLLLHDRKLLLMVPTGVDIFNVLLVEEHLTLDRVVEPLNQGDD